ncbi:MAG: hypothetical protein K2G70_07530 [Turicibacter sp.]|nr:hypothetical protein [Turicibacter sp.]
MEKYSETLKKNNDLTDKNGDMLDWWVGTVILAFFPIFISIVISLFRNSSVDINRMIGDGELILSAFLVTTPSIMNSYKKSSYPKGGKYKKNFFLLLFAAFFQLTAYTSIKTNPTNISGVVYITSFLCVLSSILISWQEEMLLKGDDTNAKIFD